MRIFYSGTFFLLLFSVCSFGCRAQDSLVYPPNLHIIHDLKAYRLEYKEKPDSKLEDLHTFIPEIVLDIRYAGSNNFMRQAVYPQSRAFLRHAAAAELKDVENELKKSGLGLIIYDAYRPYSVTVKIFDLVKDSDYAASPKSGSRHNRGCAVDLGLIDLNSRKTIPMPTPFDSFNTSAHSDYMALPDSVLKNRALLKRVMEEHGFSELKTEWWHFDYRNWKDYQLLDIPFAEL